MTVACRTGSVRPVAHEASGCGECGRHVKGLARTVAGFENRFLGNASVNVSPTRVDLRRTGIVERMSKRRGTERAHRAPSSWPLVGHLSKKYPTSWPPEECSTYKAASYPQRC